MSGPGQPRYLGREVYKIWRLTDPTDGDTFEVFARETATGLQGWYAWFNQHGPEITWIRGLYVVHSEQVAGTGERIEGERIELG